MLTVDQKKLVENNMGLAYMAAARAKKQNKIEWEEVFSLAQFALCKAAVKFNPKKECAFSAFYMVCFESELLMEFRRRKASNRRINYECVSLNAALECDEKLELMETIATPVDNDPWGTLDNFDKRAAVAETMRKCLNDTTYKVIYMTFWRDMKQLDIAKELNCSQSYVSRLIREGKKIIGEQMKAQGYGA